MPQLIQIPVWRDNYAYLVIHEDRAFVVDSPEAAPVLERLHDFPGVRLEAVVNTHHHGDHVGSNADLVRATGCDVVGPAHDAARIPGLTRRARIGDVIDVAGLPLRVLDVRAHTRGHITYACDRPFEVVVRHGHGRSPLAIERLAGRPALFVGDSLFAAGCGRLFEGTPADLVAAMRTLATENPAALVCCAHEYTAANLRFAVDVLPDLSPLVARHDSLDAERTPSGSSVPDTLARELETNPFLLVLDPMMRNRLAQRVGADANDVVAVAGAVRAAKDHF